jgi:HNH endonuclease
MKTTKKQRSGCVIYKGPKNCLGYGYVRSEDGTVSHVHELAWERTCGAIPEGKRVVHACANLACVKVGHLYLAEKGTLVRIDDEERSYTDTIPLWKQIGMTMVMNLWGAVPALVLCVLYWVISHWK